MRSAKPVAGFAALAALLCVAPATAQDPPLFEAFKRLCVDTDIHPAAVLAELAKMQAQRHATQFDRDYDFTRNLYGSWEFSIRGNRMQAFIVNTTHSQMEVPEAVTASCVINSYAPDDAGVAAIRAWADERQDNTHRLKAHSGRDSSSVAYGTTIP